MDEKGPYMHKIGYVHWWWSEGLLEAPPIIDGLTLLDRFFSQSYIDMHVTNWFELRHVYKYRKEQMGIESEGHNILIGMG